MGYACAHRLTVFNLILFRGSLCLMSELAIVAMLSAGRKNMGIAGNLATMSVVDLLQFLETGQKSGVLRVSRESVTKEIFLEKGFIIGSTSTDPKEYFGQFLLHYGKIDEPQLRLALENQRQTAASAARQNLAFDGCFQRNRDDGAVAPAGARDHVRAVLVGTG